MERQTSSAKKEAVMKNRKIKMLIKSHDFPSSRILNSNTPPAHTLQNSIRRAIAGTMLALLGLIFPGPLGQAAVVVDPAAWGLAVGDTFRLVVVTQGTTNASSADISTYDTFVNTQGLSGIHYNGESMTWQAMGTTMDSVASSDSARFSSKANSTKVFNLGGEMVSNNNFWDINHDAPINMTIDGSGALATLSSGRAYTGFGYDGKPRPQRNHTSEWESTDVYSALGQTASYTGVEWDIDMNPVLVPGLTWGVAAGNISTSRASWPDGVYVETPDTVYHHMYAISDLITVVADPIPEPASLAFAGALFLIGHRFMRRNEYRLNRV